MSVRKTAKRILKERTATVVFAFLIFSAAFYLRVKWTGTLPLVEKDLYHLYVGRALFADGSMALPSGRVYPRGLLQSFFVGLSMTIFGSSSWAIRLPSVFFGVLLVVLVFTHLNRVEGAAVGLAAALLVALSPTLIGISSSARMYSLAAFLHVIFAVGAANTVIHQDRHKHPFIVILVMLLAAAALASLVHRFVLLSAGSLFGVTILFALEESRIQGAITEIRAHRIKVLGVTAAVIVLSTILPINLLSPASIDFSSIQWWYSKELIDRFTLLSLFVLPLIISVVVNFISERRLDHYAVHAVFLIGPLFAMDVFLTDFTHQKYLTVLLTPFFVVSILGVRKVVRFFDELGTEGECLRPSVVVALLLVVATISFPVSTVHAIESNPDEVPLMAQTSLTEAHQYISGNVDEDDVVISYYPEGTLAEVGQVGYYLRQKDEEKFGGAEPISGAPIISNQSELQSVVEEVPDNADVWILWDQHYADLGFITDDSIHYISTKNESTVGFYGTSDSKIWGSEIYVTKISR